MTTASSPTPLDAAHITAAQLHQLAAQLHDRVVARRGRLTFEDTDQLLQIKQELRHLTDMLHNLELAESQDPLGLPRPRGTTPE